MNSLQFGAALMQSPRRNCFSVSSTEPSDSTQTSATRLLVGVKCIWKRGRLANQFRISAVLWVA